MFTWKERKSPVENMGAPKVIEAFTVREVMILVGKQVLASALFLKTFLR